MDFSQVEAEFQRLKGQFEDGAITEDEFKAQLQELMIEDEEGKWWIIGYETGQWYYHDGEKWVQGEPPRAARLPALPSILGIQLSWQIVAIAVVIALVSVVLIKVWGPTKVVEVVATTTPASPTPTQRPPTPTPTPTCALTPAEVFANAWNDPAVRKRIGCPINQEHIAWIAEEKFEGGYMFWRKDTDRIYALYDDHTWQNFADIWQEEKDPEYPCPEVAPSTSPPTPKRGFGMIWCLELNVRRKLGQAMEEEKGADQWVQDFEEGMMIRSDMVGIGILYNDGYWQSY